MVKRDDEIQGGVVKVVPQLLKEERQSEGGDADRAVNLDGLSSLLPTPSEGGEERWRPTRPIYHHNLAITDLLACFTSHLAILTNK
jgi:hypothetical protein